MVTRRQVIIGMVVTAAGYIIGTDVLKNKKPKPTPIELDNFLKELFYEIKDKFNGIEKSKDISGKVLSNVIKTLNCNETWVGPGFELTYEGQYIRVNIDTTDVYAQKYMALIKIAECLENNDQQNIKDYINVLKNQGNQPITMILPRIMDPDLNIGKEDVGNQFQYSIYIAKKILEKYNLNVKFCYLNGLLFTIIEYGDNILFFPHPTTIFSCDDYHDAMKQTMDMYTNAFNERDLGYLEMFYLRKGLIIVDLFYDHEALEYKTKDHEILFLVNLWENPNEIIPKILQVECDRYSIPRVNIDNKVLEYLRSNGINITEDDVQSWEPHYLSVVSNIFINYEAKRLGKIIDVLRSMNNIVFSKSPLMITL